MFSFAKITGFLLWGQSLVPCASICERNMLADTAKIVDKNKISKRKDDVCRKIVTDGLLGLGYDASICKSRWEKAPSYPAGTSPLLKKWINCVDVCFLNCIKYIYIFFLFCLVPGTTNSPIQLTKKKKRNISLSYVGNKKIVEFGNIFLFCVAMRFRGGNAESRI
jgi:hypothetical protein